MRKRSIAIIVTILVLIVVLLTALQAYSLYTAAKGVSISISKLGAENVGISSATVLITLAFTNPSSTSLPPVQVNFSAFLAGKFIGNGTLPQVIISGNTVVEQIVPFNVTYTTVAVGVINSLVKGEYNVSAIGRASVKILFSLVPISTGFTVSLYCPNLKAQNCTHTYALV
jgi:hypothetical protein